MAGNKMLRATGKREAPIRGDDFYPTPPIATAKLVDRWKQDFQTRVWWEPACGDGAICDVLSANGIRSVGTDLVDRGYGAAHGIDFLMEQKKWDGCTAMITNPPFKLAEQFIEKAMDLRMPSWMLLRLNFLEGVKRRALLERYLVRAEVFSARLPMMHRPNYTGKKNESGAVCFAWFHFNPSKKDYTLPVIGWL
jgi:hypothetical protein